MEGEIIILQAAPDAILSGTVTFSGYVYIPGKTVGPVALMLDGLLSG
jgi:hypothetical protein